MGVGVGVSGIGEIRFAGSFFGRGLKYSVIFFRLGVFLGVCFLKFFGSAPVDAFMSDPPAKMHMSSANPYRNLPRVLQYYSLMGRGF